MISWKRHRTGNHDNRSSVKMNHRSLIVIALCVAASSIPISAAAEVLPRFSITIQGGINRLWSAEWAEALEADDLTLAMGNLGPSLLTQNQTSTTKLTRAGFDVEFMIRLTRKFRLAASVGYLPLHGKAESNFSAQAWQGTHSLLGTDYTFDVKLFPVTATLAYRFFRSGSSALDVSAGVVYYRIDAESSSTLDRSFTSPFTGARVRSLSEVDIPDADGDGWGFHCGLDLEQKIAARWALVIGGRVNFGPRIKAHGPVQRNEKLYHEGQLVMEFSPPVENGPVPPVSHFDLSGLSFHLGLRVNL